MCVEMYVPSSFVVFFKTFSVTRCIAADLLVQVARSIITYMDQRLLDRVVRGQLTTSLVG